MAVTVNGRDQEDIQGFNWHTRVLTGATAPIVQTRGYDTTTDSVRTISGATAVTFLYKSSSRSNAGDIITWVPANTLRSKVLLFTMSGTAAALLAFRENTGTIGTPVWTSRFEFRLGGDGPGVALALPEQNFGPVGDGAGATAKLEVISGTLTAYGTLHGYESST